LESENSLPQDPSKDSAEPKIILFFGNSLTAGYGLEPTQAFPALIQEKINAQGWNFTAINAGLSGESTAGGLRRIDWLLKRKIDVLVLELGANDGLRGAPVETIRQNLQAIIEQTTSRYPSVKVVIVGMQIPPNLGRDYASRFRSIFPQLAEKNHALLIPFLLEGVAGIPQFNLPDGIHPTAAGHRMVAENVWKVLQPLLRSVP
jgi:acyl-CoA thioesterase-1